MKIRMTSPVGTEASFVSSFNASRLELWFDPLIEVDATYADGLMNRVIVTCIAIEPNAIQSYLNTQVTDYPLGVGRVIRYRLLRWKWAVASTLAERQRFRNLMVSAVQDARQHTTARAVERRAAKMWYQ